MACGPVSEDRECYRAHLVARLALAYLALSALAVGVPASFEPRTFYDRFPFVTDWVDLLPPYNEHLTADVGGLQLAFRLLFAYAAARPTRTLVPPACAVWSVSQPAAPRVRPGPPRRIRSCRRDRSNRGADSDYVGCGRTHPGDARDSD
jgi:hypothetical protein